MFSYANDVGRKVTVSSIMEHLFAHWCVISQNPYYGVNLIEFLAKGENMAALSFGQRKAMPAQLKDNQLEV